MPPWRCWSSPNPENFRAPCTETARRTRSLAAMRNPIQASVDRPVPLPDCILRDAWWADLRTAAAAPADPVPPAAWFSRRATDEGGPRLRAIDPRD